MNNREKMNREERVRRRAAQMRRKFRRKMFRMLAAVLFLAAVCMGIWNIKVTEVQVTGNERYSGQQIADMLFSTENDRRSLLLFLRQLIHKNQEEIPILQSYTLTFTGIQSVSVSVQEKKLVGCISHMGSYMYFDQNGLIVESRTEPYPGIPIIEGIDFDQAVLYQKISAKKEGIFDTVMTLTQLLSQHEIQADRILYDERDRAALIMGDVRVELGSSDNMDGKIAELAVMQEKFGNLKGTLHLETYDESRQDAEYYFDVGTD